MWKCKFCDTYNDDDVGSCFVCDKNKNYKKVVTLTRQRAGNLSGPNIVIPDEFNSIGKGAFKSRDDIETITIHAGIKKIPQEAFFGCVNLKKIVCLGELFSIGSKAFTNCDNLPVYERPYAKHYIANDAFSNSEELSMVDTWILELKDYISRYNKIICDTRMKSEIIQIAQNKVISTAQLIEYLETYKIQVKKGVSEMQPFEIYSLYLITPKSELEQVESDAEAYLDIYKARKKENEKMKIETTTQQKNVKKLKGFSIGLSIYIVVCILIAIILSFVS